MLKKVSKAILVGGVAFSILLSGVGKTSAATINYKDVTTKHWAYSDIQEASKLGYFVGDDKGNFNPENKVTRAEFATVLSKMFDSTARSNEPFVDVADNFWGKDAIEKMLALGIINANDYANKKFEPNKAMTRTELAKWFTNALAVNQPQYQEIMKTIRDSANTLLPVTEYLRGGITKAEQGYIGVMLGTELFSGYTDGSFKPNGNTSRSEVASLAIRFKNMQTKAPTEFKGLNELLEVSLTASNMETATKFKYQPNKTVKNIINKPVTLNNNVGTAKIHRLIFVEATNTAKETLNNSIYAKMFFNENQKSFFEDTIYIFIDQSLTPNKVLDHLTLANASYTGFINGNRLLENVDKYGLTSFTTDSLSKFFTVGKEKRYWTRFYYDITKPSINGFTTNDNSEVRFYSTY